METFGAYYTKTVGAEIMSLKFISRGHYRMLCGTTRTTFTLERGGAYLSHVVSCDDCENDYTYHKKLKIHKSNAGYYVTCKGSRCYCNSYIPEWFKEII